MKPVVLAPIVALALAAGGAGAYFWLTSGGGAEQEVVAQPTPTPEPSPTAAAVATPTPEPTVTIPADWQTYLDPKGRFSIHVPPDWRWATFASENYPAWLQFNIPGENENTVSDTKDGVKLEVAIIPKEPGETIEDKAPEKGQQPRLRLDYVTVNKIEAVRQVSGTNAQEPSSVGYVFDQGANWIAINLYPSGPRTQDYVATFDELIVKSFAMG